MRFVKNLRLLIASEFGFVEHKRVQKLFEGVVHSGSRLCVAVCTASIDRSRFDEDRKGLPSLVPIIASLAFTSSRVVFGNGEKRKTILGRCLPVVVDVFLLAVRRALLLCQRRLGLPFLEYMGRVVTRCNLCVCYNVLGVASFSASGLAMGEILVGSRRHNDEAYNQHCPCN